MQKFRKFLRAVEEKNSVQMGKRTNRQTDKRTNGLREFHKMFTLRVSCWTETSNIAIF